MLVFDLISKWTLEEREQLNDLIKASFKMEIEVAVNRELSLKGLKVIRDHLIGGLIEREVKVWHIA
jgi:hypothetical protein